MRSIGFFGEQIAVQYLQEQGYTLIEKNYYTRFGEIDIVCQKDGVIIFVEVKTRTSDAFGYPESSISPKKIKSLLATATRYMIGKHQEWQIDVLAITLSESSGAEIKHFYNITG